MKNEHQILNTIEENNEITQRDIAKYTGLSLGSVNIIIKRLIKKGFIKMEKLSPRTIRYILTPEGIRQKATATYNYVISSYKYINEINLKIEKMLHDDSNKDIDEMILFGSTDEILSLLQSRLKQHNIQFTHILSVDMLKELCTTGKKNSKIIAWEPDRIEQLLNSGVPFINFIDLI